MNNGYAVFTHYIKKLPFYHKYEDSAANCTPNHLFFTQAAEVYLSTVHPGESCAGVLFWQLPGVLIYAWVPFIVNTY